MVRILLTVGLIIIAFINGLAAMAGESNRQHSQIKLNGQDLQKLRVEEAGGLFTEELQTLEAAGLSADELSTLSAVDALKIIGAYYSYNGQYAKARPYFRLTLELLEADPETDQSGENQADVKACMEMIRYLDRMIAG